MTYLLLVYKSLSGSPVPRREAFGIALKATADLLKTTNAYIYRMTRVLYQ